MARGAKAKQYYEMNESRVIAWFSCGASSAVAAKLAIEKYGDRCSIVYCDTMSTEHPDNQRFFDDVQRWLKRSIQRIKSEKYNSVNEVFDRLNYMGGIYGAPCTVEMKKVPRFKFQKSDDMHIFGLTLDEKSRIERFEYNNFDLKLDWILRDMGYTKKLCLYEIESANIKLPEMYSLGFENNNCLGCVKASSPDYWRRTRRFFPDVFESRAKRSREIGARLVRINGERKFLDELPPDAELALWQGIEEVKDDLSCGPECASDSSNKFVE